MSDGDNETEAIAHRQLQERAGRLRQTLDEALREFVQPLELPASGGTASMAPALRALRDALQAIAAAGAQKDVLQALLDAASGCYARSALFVMKRDGLRGWAGRGFDPESGCDDRKIPGIVLPIAGDHLLARAVQSRSLMIAGIEGPGEAVIGALGGTQPHEAGAMPIMLRDRPVALLYGDSGSSRGRSDALWLEIIGRIGGLALANLAGEPARRAHQDPVADRGEIASPAATAPPETSTPTGPPADPELQPLLADLGESPRREMGEGEQPVSEEVRRWHEDARRFASLLVSELMLYNEEAVIQGRRNRDLRQRLGTEIERSRQAYASRVSPEIAGSTSFFDDELIRVLAEGDASLIKS
jgi:hypothetical protein